MTRCEEMAELLSAWHDGELDAIEIRSVEEHLETCPHCRELKDRFSQVDSLVLRFPPEPKPELESDIRHALTPRSQPRGMRRLLSLATAALILIAVSLALLVTGDRADARRMATEYMASLDAMSDKTIETQDVMLKTMEWDLNAMKLMVDCSDIESNEAKELKSQIENLLLEVERLQKTEDATSLEDKTKGEKK